MRLLMRSKLGWVAGGLLLVLLGLYCTESPGEQAYANHAAEVAYVGMETCRSCHAEIHETFIHTGMGESLDWATREKSQAEYGPHALVYDTATNFYYFPYWRGEVLWIKEFRLADGDTIYKREEQVTFIIGSGHHTNSHLIQTNGYLTQAPITYYTQEGKWDMAPGFKEGENLRFSRVLTSECITCHNHFPTLAEGALHKYETMPTGIECERCHGPGEVHVREKLAGHIVDTSQFIDYTIVNPAKLSRERQMDLCQRCHLQGVAVLKAGKTFYDFKPGLPLADYINVFLPRYDNSHEKFIMASQADRLRQSSCYRQSAMTCITCHNPHQSVRQSDARQHNAACLTCHKSEVACTAPPAALAEAENNCVHCHMPKSGSKDIPHVRITDHFISKDNTPISRSAAPEAKAPPRFLGLQLMTKERGSPLEMAQGYLACYDKYIPAAVMLDSAYYYLNAAQLPLTESYPSWVHYHFNRQDYPAILELIPMLDTSSITDAWTNYRIGEACLQADDAKSARQFYRKAVQAMPYHLDFQEKLGTAELYLKRNRAAKEIFDFVLSENEKRPLALLNRGYLYALEGDLQNAENYYNRALALEPDYIQALLNKAAIYIFQKEFSTAKELLVQVLRIEPDNPQAQSALNQLKSK